MYMEIKLFGLKFRPIIVLLSGIVGMLIGVFVLCSCSKVTAKDIKEGFESLGAPTSYNMNNGVPGYNTQKNLQNIAPALNTNKGPKLPLPPGQLFFFADNEFKPECCSPPFSNVSSADGCACVTKEQVDYINARGGNRSNGEVY